MNEPYNPFAAYPTPQHSGSQPQLGIRIRALRQAKSYTIEQVALLSGLSKAFISMLENGKTGISADKLERLASIFGLSASDLLPSTSSHSFIQLVRAAERPLIPQLGAGITARLLTKDLHRRLQPVLMTLEPDASHTNEIGHAGEELVYLLSGKLCLTVDTVEVNLEPGDTAYYPSALRHRFFNPGKEVATLITISTPPKLI